MHNNLFNNTNIEVISKYENSSVTVCPKQLIPMNKYGLFADTNENFNLFFHFIKVLNI